MSSPSTPKRVTRSMSHQPSPPSSDEHVVSTTPGRPVTTRNSSNKFGSIIGLEHPSNPYQVDFVIPFDVSVPKGQDRATAQGEIKEGYERLLRALEGEGGLKVGTKSGRGGKGKEEVWVFVSTSDKKLSELVERER